MTAISRRTEIRRSGRVSALARKSGVSTGHALQILETRFELGSLSRTRAYLFDKISLIAGSNLVLSV